MTGRIQYRASLDEYPIDSADSMIQELYDLIEHQPKRGGLFGLQRSKYEQYLARISEAIVRLEQ